MATKPQTIEILRECHVRAVGERNKSRSRGDRVIVDERTAYHLIGIGRARMSDDPIGVVDRDTEVSESRKRRA